MTSNENRKQRDCSEDKKEKKKHRHGQDRSGNLEDKQNVEYNRRLYHDWERVKEDAKDEEKSRLRTKVQLQRELIRNQELLSQIKQKELEEEHAKQRVAERAARKAKLDGLARQIKKPKGETAALPTAFSPSASRKKLKQQKDVGSDDVRARGGNFEDQKLEEVDEDSSRNFAEFDADDRSSRSTVDSDVKEESLSEEDVFPSGEGEPIPWHHVQLYSLYGKNANYYLHPKMEVEKRRNVLKPIEKQLKEHQGYVGAETLWSILRNKSNKKIVREDNKISDDLKLVYKAFIRERLRGKVPKDEDELVKLIKEASVQVPEIGKLIDDSRLHRTQERRHKSQLMFRLSKKHEERTKILLYNNPLSDLHNPSGEDRIARYMQSATPEEGMVQEPGDDLCLEGSTASSSIDAVVEYKEDGDAGKDCYCILNTKSGWDEPRIERVRCIFLTEADTNCEGKFSKKRKELEDAKNVDLVYNTRAEATSAGDIEDVLVKEFKRTSAEIPSQKQSACTTKPKGRSYEPLTLAALMDYATVYKAPGQGNFSFGKVPMWPCGGMVTE